MSEQIIYELNGIKYLLIEGPIDSGNSGKMSKELKELGAIYQGVKEINKGSFWTGGGFVVLKYLIPENKINEL